MNGNPFDKVKHKAPRPTWPWFIGAAAVTGGVTWLHKKNLERRVKSSDITPPYPPPYPSELAIEKK